LKDVKILNELNKGVMSLKSYVYPSVLQKEAIPVIKGKGKSNNVIIRYSTMSGIKLTVLLPLLNQLIRDVTIN
jgi:Lhr-like helicase